MGYAPRQMSNEFAILSRQSEQKGLGCGFVFWCVVFFPVALIMLMNRSKQLGEHTHIAVLADGRMDGDLAGPG